MGLILLWKFDEGRGSVTVDSASWRSGEGVAVFGVISPAVAVGPTAVSHLGTTPGSSTEVIKRQTVPLATWGVSTAPIGGLERSYDGRPFLIRLTGSDAHMRPLVAVMTRAPSGGSLAVARLIGESTSRAEEPMVLGLGDTIPLGTKLIYRPNAGAHDPWLEGSVGEYGDVVDWTVEGESYDSFSYRVETDGGEASANYAVVELSVRPGMHPAHLDWTEKVRIFHRRQ